MSPHVDALRNDLAAAAALGDERAAEVGGPAGRGRARARRRCASSRRSARRCSRRTSSCRPATSSCGWRANDPSVVFVEEEAAVQPPAADEPSAARLTLRLPERLKSELEAAAAREGVSVNTWLVRALAGAVSHATRPSRPGRRLVGYGRT